MIRFEKIKINKMISLLKSNTKTWPERNRIEYWNAKIPCNKTLLDSKDSSEYIKSKTVQTLFETVNHLVSVKPNKYKDSIVTAVITLPNLWSSEICIFFCDNYYNQFMKRLIELEESNVEQFKNRFNVQVKEGLKLKGFMYNTIDADEEFSQHWWIYGEL